MQKSRDGDCQRLKATCEVSKGLVQDGQSWCPISKRGYSEIGVFVSSEFGLKGLGRIWPVTGKEGRWTYRTADCSKQNGISISSVSESLVRQGRACGIN